MAAVTNWMRASVLSMVAAMAFAPVSAVADPTGGAAASVKSDAVAQRGPGVIWYSGADNADAIVDMAKEQSKTTPAFIMLASRTCGYCDDLSAMFTRVSQQLSIPVTVLKVDIDAYPSIKSGLHFRRATPDTRAYQNGQEAYSFLGALPYENMVKGLKSMSMAISGGTRPGSGPGL